MTGPIERAPRSRLSVSTLILSLIAGIMLTVPFKVIHEQQSEPKASESRQELANRILKITEENDQLRIELTQLRDNNAKLEENLMQREQTSSELVETRRNYRIMAGLDSVHGPGIKLTLTENPPQVQEGSQAEPYIIHQEDLLNIVNELWLAGAEAVAIGSRGHVERLVVRSTIRCIGPMIDINNTRMAPPFEIYAIGNTDNLYSSLTMPGGVLQPLSFFNIQATIDKSNDLTVPPYSGSTLFQYAHPVGE